MNWLDEFNGFFLEKFMIIIVNKSKKTLENKIFIMLKV